jgi:maleate isomerase
LAARIGIICTPDNANDRDFWQWCPPGATLLFTRTVINSWWLETVDPASPQHDDWVPTDEELIDATRSLALVGPLSVTYACTSGSVRGPSDNESRIRRTIEDAGARVALTTASSVVDALDALGATAVAIGTPYDATTTIFLGRYLERCSFVVRSLERETSPTGLETDMTRDQIRTLALRADRPDADVLFLSCAALATFDVIPELENQLGKPVITSSQATMWAALGAAGVSQVEAPQTLIYRTWEPSPRRHRQRSGRSPEP